jgi:hypothetical protein
MKHIMLDLETLDTAANSAILSIGAVSFTMDGGIHDKIHLYVHDNDDNSTVTVDTLLWWMGQDENARAAQIKAERQPMSTALGSFAGWVEKQGDLAGMWGNGAAFDNVILRSAYERNGFIVPWSHRVDRCFRTMKRMFPSVEADTFVGVKHDALDDAANQAMHLCKIMKSLS